ncbi:MAG: peptidylprolyl isomerase [Balneolaceae bacterium]
MKYILRTLLFFVLFFTYTYSAYAQSGEVSDRIIAIVNDRIILKSDVDDEIRDYMRQAELSDQQMQFSEDLWYSALQSMVDNYVLLEQAKIDSIDVPDELVDQQMDQRIQQLVRQAGSEQALEEAFGKSLIQLRADFREQFREQMVIQQVQQSKMGSVNITRPEVKEFFESIPEDSIPTIPEQVGVSQIVVIPAPLEDAKQQAYQQAAALRDSVVEHGRDFEEMARKYSDDISATRGGLLPMMPLGDLVANYSAAATALEPGEISEVVETQFGYHVIRLNRRVGDNIETNHILIRVDEELVDEDFAINKLEALRDSVLNHGVKFSDLARRHSDDEETKVTGGRVMNPQTGERLMPLSELNPSLYRIVLLLDEEGQISEPRSYNTQGRTSRRAYRIVRLDRLIPEHRANLEDDFNRIRDIALQQKRMRVMNEWIEDLRDDFFIEFKIPMPQNITETL